MDFNDYQKAAFRTARKDLSEDQLYANFGMGLSGEAGEVTDYLKKVLFHGHTLDRDVLKKEIGDCLWYCAGLATVAELSLEEIAEANVEKLNRRYSGDGFSTIDSVKRKDVEGD